MTDCSLCGGSIQAEGGAILFTDKWGIPYEVCGSCEHQVDILQNAGDEAEKKEALDYVTRCAGNKGDRNDYEAIMHFVRENATLAEIEGEAEDHHEAGEVSPEAAAAEKKSKRRDLLLLILLVVLLILASVFSGFKF